MSSFKKVAVDDVLQKSIAFSLDKDIFGTFSSLSDVVEIRANCLGLDTNREIKLANIGWHHQAGFKFYPSY